ncbi:MAG TPA: MauE/DoxX family redox-associated membrane protein [Burkholderiales bacterium]|nr:MauE/DoxX family redox-associated membrane protein [Burkholderiales bacterium]
MIDPVIHYVFVCLLALVFLHGGAVKLGARDEFQGVVSSYRLLPSAMVPAFAALLPLAELAAGIGVALPATRPLGAALAFALLLMFAMAMAINLARGRTEIDCGCFKSGFRQTISGWLVGRNLVLAGGAALLWLPIGARTTGSFDVFLVVAASLMLFLGYYSVGVLTRKPVTRYDTGFRKPMASRN